MAVDPTKPVRTVGEKLPVRLLCTDAKLYPQGEDSWVGLVLTRDGKEALYLWNEGGGLYRTQGTALDLENVPQKKEAWVNIYPWNKTATLHPTKDAADNCADTGRVTCIRAEWEE